MLLFTECLDHHPLISYPSDFKVAVNLVRQILITFQSNDLLYGYDDIHTYMYIRDKLLSNSPLLLYTLRPRKIEKSMFLNKKCFQEFTKVVHIKEFGSAAEMIEDFTH